MATIPMMVERELAYMNAGGDIADFKGKQKGRGVPYWNTLGPFASGR
jgi:hypothetical protein